MGKGKACGQREPKQGSSGRATLNKVPLGRENSNRFLYAGGTLENQSFLYADLGGRAEFKGSNS